MKINKIKFQNFRIYKGENEIILSPNNSKNINIIAGKNGFGKTSIFIVGHSCHHVLNLIRLAPHYGYRQVLRLQSIKYHRLV